MVERRAIRRLDHEELVMNLRPALAAFAALAALVVAGADAHAATCQVAACTAAIQAASGLVVNDIFHDANNNTAQNLPVYGTLINNFPQCLPERIDFAGAGQSNPPYNCPGQYGGVGATATAASANTFLSAVDRLWWQPCRLGNGALDANGCVKDWSCIGDDVGGNYHPWEGMVFDLGGPANKVAIFAENDHGPQPCESLEYTVFLSDNPFAHDVTDIILQPAVTGVDPNKWNRAVLSKIYTGGWVQVRPPDPANFGAACGDTADYSVEEDSFVQVFSLPCGITFRYAAIVAGNDGLDFPACAYNSNEGEIDAVAGLTESGAAVCPDNDHDHYVDCNCPGAPPVCDCNDSDPTIHPGAPEACDSTTDYNCDMQLGSCPAGLICYASTCLTPCGGGETPFCPAGSSCVSSPDGKVCVPNDCNCTPGQVCINNVCVSACQNVHCPGTQICQDGNCIEPCANILCPAGQFCEAGQCVFPCNCYAGDVGCTTPAVCDNVVGGTNTCVDPMCKGVMCGPGQTCDPSTGTCIDFCSSGVQCPEGQKCSPTDGCVPVCTGVTCPTKFTCDPMTGTCVDTSCANVTCLAPTVCMGGVCVTPDGGGSSSGSMSSSSGSGSTGTEGGSHGSGSGGADPGDQGTCGCRAVGEGDEGPLSAAGGLALLGVAIALARRKRG
jgi:MYXO-CTERM domain-containing protein